MTYDFYLDEAVKAIAYKSITEENGADSQLIAFINNDGNLGEELGLEQFSSYSNETQHEILLSKLNSDFLEKLACDDINTICQKNVVFNEEKSVIDQLELINIRLSTLLIAEDRLYSYKNRKSELLKDTSLKSDHLDSALEGLGTTIKETYTSMVAKAKESISSLGEMFPTAKSIVDKIIVKITSLIEKIKEKAEKLNKTIKAHPIKSILIAITTITAIAGAIYIYKEYNKGYSHAEKIHVEQINAMRTRHSEASEKIQQLEVNFNKDYKKLKEVQNEIDSLLKNKELNASQMKEIEKKITSIKSEFNPSDFPELQKKWRESAVKFKRLDNRNQQFGFLFEDEYRTKKGYGLLSEEQKISIDERLSNVADKIYNTSEKARAAHLADSAAIWKEVHHNETIAEFSKISIRSKELDPLSKINKELEEKINLSKNIENSLVSSINNTRTIINNNEQSLTKTESNLKQAYAFWDHNRRSLFSKTQDIFRGTFIESKADVILRDGTLVPRVEFVKMFPPPPETKTTQALNWTASNLGTLGSKLNESFSKVGNSLKEFSASASSEKITSVTSKCISAVYYLIKEIIVKCLHFISNTLISVFNQLS